NERQNFRIGSVPAEHVRLPPSDSAAGNAYACNPRPVAPAMSFRLHVGNQVIFAAHRWWNHKRSVELPYQHPVSREAFLSSHLKARMAHPLNVLIIRRRRPSSILGPGTARPSLRRAFLVKTSVAIPPWPTCNVTLLGDALHNMTPFRGIGA